MDAPRNSSRTMDAPRSRSVHVAVLGLRQALAKATASPTLQEGLYSAYTGHLRDLDLVDDIPQALGTAIHELVVDLRRAFGFDEAATGTKIAPSTLRRHQAAQLLARLEALTSSAEALAEGDETRRH